MSQRFKTIVFIVQFIASLLVCRNYGSYIHELVSKYVELTVADLRKLEKLSKKLDKAELDVTFLKNCQTFHVTPKFLCFDIPYSNVVENKRIRKRLLRNALHKRISESKCLSRDLLALQQKVQGILPSLEWYFLRKHLRVNLEKVRKKIISVHDKKMRGLTRNSELPFKAGEIITNLSNRKLTWDESELLKHGLGYAIPWRKINETDVRVSLELIYVFMTKNLKEKKNEPRIRIELSHLANTFYSDYKPSSNILRKHKILDRLRADKSIVILKPDKGNGVVVLNKNDYTSKVLGILSDPTKFKEINSLSQTGKDVTLFREGQLQRYLVSLKGKFTNEIYTDIYPSGSIPSKMYGLPKIHKMSNNDTLPPFRPIVSSLGAFNHKLAKFLASVLQPLIPTEYSVNDTFSFVADLQNRGNSANFLVSFDVVSLFTNIPLEESIKLAVDKIYQSGVTKFTKKELHKLLVFCTSQTHFLFNGKYYDQIDGVCMGSPLGPVLANLFMGVHEKEWIQNYPGSGLNFYKRYVDDICCSFNSESDAHSFFTFLNTRHPNIKFTSEKEANGILPFLDVNICKTRTGTLETNTYYKPTYTGLLTNFTSYVPFIYKIGLAKTLFDRASKICSNAFLLKADIHNISRILHKNQFPSHTISKGLKKNKKRAISSNTPPDEPETETRYFKIPYNGDCSRAVTSKIRQLANKYCKNIDIKIIFDSFKIGSLFSVKDKTPDINNSHVVYKFTCFSCNATYVGETHRHFHTRVKEHMLTDKNSAVNQHLQGSPACKALCTIDSFEILDRASTKFQLCVKEALFIKQLAPSLNKQVKSYIVKIV